METKFYSFKQWGWSQIQAIEPGEFISLKCPECSGDGEIECDCCGHTNECENCDGRGYITIGYNDIPTVKEPEEFKVHLFFKKTDYWESIATTCFQFMEWRGLSPDEMAKSLGVEISYQKRYRSAGSNIEAFPPYFELCVKPEAHAHFIALKDYTRCK